MRARMVVFAALVAILASSASAKGKFQFINSDPDKDSGLYLGGSFGYSIGPSTPTIRIHKIPRDILEVPLDRENPFRPENFETMSGKGFTSVSLGLLSQLHLGRFKLRAGTGVFINSSIDEDTGWRNYTNYPGTAQRGYGAALSACTIEGVGFYHALETSFTVKRMWKRKLVLEALCGYMGFSQRIRLRQSLDTWNQQKDKAIDSLLKLDRETVYGGVGFGAFNEVVRFFLIGGETRILNIRPAREGVEYSNDEKARFIQLGLQVSILSVII